MSIQSYRDLIVWQEAMELAKAVYHVTESYPKQELYGLVSQLSRCAVSVPANIAEGHARASTRDYLRHLSIAAGSLAEIETQLLLSSQLGFLAHCVLNEMLNRCDVLSKRLRRLTDSLKNRLTRSGNE
jgi:four helix bundle protein